MNIKKLICSFACSAIMIAAGLSSAGSIEASADEVHTAPSGVTMVSPNGKYNKIDVKWNPSIGAAKYKVLIANADTNSALSSKTVVSNQCTFKNLDPGVEYKVQVVAYFGDNDKKKSKVVRVGTAPKPPKNFRMTERTYYSAVMTWEEAENADGYHFYFDANNKPVETRTTQNYAEFTKYIRAGEKNSYFVRSKKYLSTGKVIYSKYKHLTFNIPSAQKTLSIRPISQLATNGGLNGTIYASCGCGPTALTMVINGDKNQSYTKDTALQTGYSRGYCHNVTQNYGAQLSYIDSYVGTTLEDIQSIASAMGYRAKLDHMYGESQKEVLKKIDILLDSNKRIVIGHRMTAIRFTQAPRYGTVISCTRG